jgi:hypothetical protein
MIRWSTLVANPEDGTIDYPRVRSLFGVVLAGLAGLATIWVVFMARDVNETLVGIMVTACVLPLTGGKIADAIAQRSAATATAKVVAGAAPDRRASAPDIPRPTV